MIALPPALAEELSKAVRQAPKPSFDPFTGEMDASSADGIVAALAPILSRALAEAEQRGSAKAWNEAKELVLSTLQEGYPLVDGETALEMVARLSPNPYLTEKEKSNDDSTHQA